MVDMHDVSIQGRLMSPPELDIHTGLTLAVIAYHNASRKAGWYTDIKTGEPLKRNVPEMMCLIHSEISEALEGVRKQLKDDKLPHRSAVECELADALIRIFDLAGYLELDLAGAVIEKGRYNAVRSDHKIENRKKEGGKAF